MRYVSTRGGAPAQRFCDVLLEGLAADGGLAVPETIPVLTPSELAGLRRLDYRGLACAVLAHFIDDISPAVLKDIVARSYTATRSEPTRSCR